LDEPADDDPPEGSADFPRDPEALAKQARLYAAASTPIWEHLRDHVVSSNTTLVAVVACNFTLDTQGVAVPYSVGFTRLDSRGNDLPDPTMAKASLLAGLAVLGDLGDIEKL
jgi:hypothetical protein